MKTVSLALAALIAVSGAAFAGDTAVSTKKQTAKPVQQSQQIDTTRTSSISTNDARSDVNKPRIGIDLNPFSFGTFH